jgi:glucose-6-phosphate isomerase
VTIRLAFDRMMSDRIPSGVLPDEWVSLGTRVREAMPDVQTLANAGRLGFRDLEAQAEEFDKVVAFAAEARGRYDDIVVLGIGGSALGAIALRTALGTAEARPRLHVLDNVDPVAVATTLGMLTLSRTCFVVISKSGTTVETMAQYAIVRARLDAAALPARAHLVFVTDPERGALRLIASAEEIPAFAVPENVGGRFSVFTPVGTLPAALAGWDVAAFVAGALAMRDRCDGAALETNPAAVFATLQWRAHQMLGQGIHVLMPYCDALRDVAPWFAQLWAESLGKIDRDGLSVGPTPLAARGATDQHSQLQLFMEGPADKTVTFLAAKRSGDDLVVAPDALLPEALHYVRGHTLGALLDAEQEATAEALASAGRPSMTITVDAADAWHVGGLMMLFMQATVLAGALYRVDPLDQPGVELGKKLAKAALAAPPVPTGASRWTV